MASSRSHYHIKTCTCLQPSICQPWVVEGERYEADKLNMCVSDFLTWGKSNKWKWGTCRELVSCNKPAGQQCFLLVLLCSPFLSLVFFWQSFFFYLVILWRRESNGSVDSYKTSQWCLVCIQMFAKNQSLRNQYWRICHNSWSRLKIYFFFPEQYQLMSDCNLNHCSTTVGFRYSYQFKEVFSSIVIWYSRYPK